MREGKSGTVDVRVRESDGVSEGGERVDVRV